MHCDALSHSKFPNRLLSIYHSIWPARPGEYHGHGPMVLLAHTVGTHACTPMHVRTSATSALLHRGEMPFRGPPPTRSLYLFPIPDLSRYAGVPTRVARATSPRLYRVLWPSLDQQWLRPHRQSESETIRSLTSMSPLWPSSGLGVTTCCYRWTHIRLIATACSSV